ncbi:MAG: substrate-binding domain-containing protein, partial [Terriglobales bacterium]
MINGRRVFVLLMWVAIVPCAAQAKQFAIVADKANSVSNLTASELVKIFTAHKQNWPDGKAITIVMRDPSSADMQLVLRKLMNMTAEQAHAFVLAHRDV